MYLIRIKDSVVAGGEGPRGRWRHSQRLPVIKFATTPSRLTTVSSSLLHLLQHCTQCSSTALQCGVVQWCGSGTLCSCTSSLLQYTAMWCALWCALWWAAELYSTGTHCPQTQFCIASVEQLYNTGSSKGV